MALVTPGGRLRTNAATARSFACVVALPIRHVLMCSVTNAAARKSRAVVLILCALHCVMRCIENHIQLLNRKAYFQTSLWGSTKP